MVRKLSNGINPDQLNQLIKDLGVRVRLYKSTLCPNITSLESMDHDFNCKLCNNNMIDFCPTETIALFQQQQLTEQFKTMGTFSLDEVQVSFLAGITLQTFAKVELLDFEEDFYELVHRQVGSNTDILKYEACSIVGLFDIDKLNNKIISYERDSDFKIDVNGNIEWLSDPSSRKPADKKVFSIYYKYHPVYRATKSVHRDRFSQFNLRVDKLESPKITIEGKTFVKLQENWILQRDYLIEKRDIDGNIIPQNDSPDLNE